MATPDYAERAEPVKPPEIREPEERFRLIEFYADLGAPRPDLQAVRMIHGWLKDHAPLPLASIQFHYQPETDEQPALLVSTLYVGEPLDIG